jgi:predicted small lipoprotein YifL
MKGDTIMKRILSVFLVLCVAFSLAACGGRSSKADKEADKASKALEDLVKDAKKIDTEEEAEKFVEDLTGWDIDYEDENNFSIGLGDDTTLSFRTGDDIKWDPDKIGGLPEPKGVTVYMEADMSALFGEEYSFSYSVNGLTKEAYKEYAEIVKKHFPKLIIESSTDEEATLWTGSEDGKESVMLTYVKDGTSIVQYIR